MGKMMKKIPQHSPLPFSVDPEGVIATEIEDTNGNVIGRAIGERHEADSEFIVRACNTSPLTQRLADALNKIIARLDYNHRKGGIFNTKDAEAITEARQVLTEFRHKMQREFDIN